MRISYNENKRIDLSFIIIPPAPSSFKENFGYAALQHFTQGCKILFQFVENFSPVWFFLSTLHEPGFLKIS